MKATFLLIGLAILLSLAGCGNDKASVRLIDRAEALLETNPDSTYILLDSISKPYELSERLLARWCMLYGKAADKTYKEMPYVPELKRAQTWFRKHGTVEEQTQIGLFLGRSYVEDKEYDKAMDVYILALTLATENKNYNQAGYICSYMADLYGFDEMNVLAADKYKEAATYFRLAKNERSYALALRDVGCMYASMDSSKIALNYLHEADTITTSLGDSSAMCSIYNGLGNVYGMLKQLELAEKYQLESIRLDSTDNAPKYLALAEVYRESGDYQKARLYLDKASISSYNEYIPIAIVYDSYLIEKAENNLTKAFLYLEEYILMADSIRALQNKANIIDVEKRFEHLKVLTDNMLLRVDKQHNLILFISLLTFCLFVMVLYQVNLTRKNRKISEQHHLISNLSKELCERKEELSKQALLLEANKKLLNFQDSFEEQEAIYKRNQQEVKQLYDILIQLRKDRLQTSAIARKLQTLSAKVLPGVKKSLLSEKDWKTIVSTVNEIYSPLTDKLLEKELSLTPTELRYCYLVLFELDSNAEAILLNISTDSVNKNYQRLRQKLEVKGGKGELYAYLVNLA